MLIVAFIVLNGTDSRLRSPYTGLITLGTEQVHTYVSLVVSVPLTTPVTLIVARHRYPCVNPVERHLRSCFSVLMRTNRELGYLVGATYVHIG
jgi:hypothetical protein